MLSSYKALLSSKRIILASASERRKDILNVLGVNYKVVHSPFDEDLNRPATNDPSEFTMWTASQKASAVVDMLKNDDEPPEIVIGADTVVIHNNTILGKPITPENAKTMLRKLSGKTHSVVTGMSIFYKIGESYRETKSVEVTQVRMAPLTDLVIDSYVNTGEPLDKAGSYGIQGLGGTLIQSIDGDYFNVVGFPLHRFTLEILNILKDLGED